MTTPTPRRFHRGAARRVADRVFVALVRRGVTAGGTVVLVVPGRTSGVERSVPVSPIEHGGHRWLVAPYGRVAWVHNVRAAPTAVLQAGRRRDRVRLVEVPPDEGAPVLRAYVQRVPLARPWVGVAPDAPVEAFAPAIAEHPVFRVDPV